MAAILSPSHNLSSASARMRALHDALQRALPFRAVALDDLNHVWQVVDRVHVARATDRAIQSLHACAMERNCITPSRMPARHRSHEVVDNGGDSFRPAVDTLAWTHVPVKEGVKGVRAAIDHSLVFPIILKRRLACGTKASHDMVIAYDMEGVIKCLSEVFGVRLLADETDESDCYDEGYASVKECDMVDDCHDRDSITCGLQRKKSGLYGDGDFGSGVIAQQFVRRHGGILFKVYAIGEDITIQTRASVQVSQEAMAVKKGYYYFNSQHLDRTQLTLSYEGRHHDITKPSASLIRNVVQKIRQQVDLSLVGIDLIYDLDTKCYNVIDINYFPGFKGMGSAPYESLLQMISSRVSDRGLLLRA